MIRTHVMICGGTGCTSSDSPKIAEAMENEIVKLGRMSPGSPEAAVIYNYVDTCLNIPWDRGSPNLVMVLLDAPDCCSPPSVKLL